MMNSQLLKTCTTGYIHSITPDKPGGKEVKKIEFLSLNQLPNAINAGEKPGQPFHNNGIDFFSLFAEMFGPINKQKGKTLSIKSASPQEQVDIINILSTHYSPEHTNTRSYLLIPETKPKELLNEYISYLIISDDTGEKIVKEIDSIDLPGMLTQGELVFVPIESTTSPEHKQAIPDNRFVASYKTAGGNNLNTVSLKKDLLLAVINKPELKEITIHGSSYISDKPAGEKPLAAIKDKAALNSFPFNNTNNAIASHNSKESNFISSYIDYGFNEDRKSNISDNRPAKTDLLNHNFQSERPQAIKDGPEATVRSEFDIKTNKLSLKQNNGTDIVNLGNGQKPAKVELPRSTYIVSRLSPVIQQMVRDNKGTTMLRIKLQPESLGEVTVRLLYNNGNLKAHFVTTTAIAKEMLEQCTVQLRENLSNLNINLTETSTSTLAGNDSNKWAQHEQMNKQQKENNLSNHQTNDEKDSKLAKNINHNNGQLNHLI